MVKPLAETKGANGYELLEKKLPAMENKYFRSM
jgi:hypothetical protein